MLRNWDSRIFFRKIADMMTLQTTLNKALDLYFTEYKTTSKQSTKDLYQQHVRDFLGFARSIDDLTTRGLARYQQHLKQQGLSNKTVNYKCRTVKMMINKVLCTHPLFAALNLTTVDYTSLSTSEPQGEYKKRRPLTQLELMRLEAVQLKKKKDEEYRDLFLLQCYTGVRVSDLHKVFDAQLQSLDGKEFIVITTEKRGTRAVIYVDNRVKRILNKYEQGFECVEFARKKFFKSDFNTRLKAIARQAGLDSLEEYIDAFGNRKKKKLHDIINTHFGRYTFINSHLRQGLSAEQVAMFSGHKNATVIRQVYTVQSDKDLAREALRLLSA